MISFEFANVKICDCLYRKIISLMHIHGSHTHRHMPIEMRPYQSRKLLCVTNCLYVEAADSCPEWNEQLLHC